MKKAWMMTGIAAALLTLNMAAARLMPLDTATETTPSDGWPDTPYPEQPRVSKPLRRNHLFGDVVMTVTHINHTEQQVEVTIVNPTPFATVTGLPFLLESFDGTDWRVVPMTGGFTLPGLTIEPFGSRSLTKNLRWYFDPLEPGLYRIRKEIDGNPHDVTAEFYWEGSES